MSLILEHERDSPKMAFELLGNIAFCAELPSMPVNTLELMPENALEIGSLTLVRNAP